MEPNHKFVEATGGFTKLSLSTVLLYCCQLITIKEPYQHKLSEQNIRHRMLFVTEKKSAIFTIGFYFYSSNSINLLNVQLKEGLK